MGSHGISGTAEQELQLSPQIPLDGVHVGIRARETKVTGMVQKGAGAEIRFSRGLPEEPVYA